MAGLTLHFGSRGLGHKSATHYIKQAGGGTVEIEHRLRPFIVLMAGADVFDPFKD